MMFLCLLSDLVLHSLESKMVLETVDELVSVVFFSRQDEVINRVTVEKIAQLLIVHSNIGVDLKLSNIELYLRDDSKNKISLIEKCVRECSTIYKSKKQEEVKVEVEEFLLRLSENIHITNCGMTKDEVESVLVRALTWVIQEKTQLTATKLEVKMFASKFSSLRRRELTNIAFARSLYYLFSRAIVMIINKLDNKSVNKMIKDFIGNNGLITVGVFVQLLENGMLSSIKNDILSNIEEVFLDLVEKDGYFFNSDVMEDIKFSCNYRIAFKEFAFWAIEMLNDSNCKLDIPSVIIKYRHSFVRAFLLDNQPLFYLIIDFYKENKKFFEENPEWIQSVKDSFSRSLNRDIGALLPAVFSVILYYNAALNGRIDEEGFYKKQRSEIFLEFIKDFNTIKNKLFFQGKHLSISSYIVHILILELENPWVNCSEEVMDKALYDIVSIVEAFKEPIICDKIIFIFERLIDFIKISQKCKPRCDQIANDKELNILLLSVLNEKAEAFISSYYSQIEKDLLHEENRSSSLLKIDMVFKTFLTSAFLSFLSKAICFIRDRESYNDKFVSLKLNEALKENFQINDCESFTKENILQQLQDRLFRAYMYSKMKDLIIQESRTITSKLVNKFKIQARDENSDCIIKRLSEQMEILCRQETEIQVLLSRFLDYVCSDISKIRASLNLNIVDFGVPILRFKAYYVMWSSIRGILGEEFVRIHGVFMKGYIKEKKREYLLFQQSLFCSSKQITTVRERFGKYDEFTHIFHGEIVDYMPFLVSSCILIVWGKHQGVSGLEKWKIKDSKLVFKEILSFDEHEEEIIQEIMSVAYSAVNRVLIALGAMLFRCKNIKEIEILESAFQHISIHLNNNQELKTCIYDVNNSFKLLLKINEHKQSVFEQKRLKKNKSKKSGYLQETKNKGLCEETEGQIDKNQETYSCKKLSLSKLEKSKLYRAKIKEKREQDKQNKIDEELLKKDLEETGLDKGSLKDLGSISEDKNSESITELGREGGSEDDSDEVLLDEFSYNMPGEVLEDVESELEALTLEEGSSKDIWASSVDKNEDSDEELDRVTLDELVYNMQEEALEEVESECGELTEEQRSLLLSFANKMKIKVVPKVYKKSRRDALKEEQLKNKVGLWGSKYTSINLEEEKGAAASLKYKLTVIMSVVFSKWFCKQNDNIKAEINKRFDKIMTTGLLGDVRALRKCEGSFELKFYNAEGSRVYYLPRGRKMYILCGGDKSDQDKILANRLPSLVKELKATFDF